MMGLPKASRCARVVGRRFECRARHADRLRGDADAAAFEVGERDAIALALAAEEIPRRHAAVLEHDLRGVGGVLAEFLLQPRDDIAGRRRRHDERADAALAGVAVGDREHDRDVGVLARGDELLGAVQHVVVAVATGGGADRRGVRAHVRLGEAERAEHVAARERHEPAFALRVGAVGEDRAADHRVLHADDGRARAVAGGDLLQREGERHVIEARAAPALRARRRRRGPARASPLSASRGKVDVRSHSAACGASSARANVRTASRIISCSGVRIIRGACACGRWTRPRCRPESSRPSSPGAARRRCPCRTA